MTTYLSLALLGLLGGASGGLLGMGGSIVMIPGLVMLRGGEGQHLYQATAMVANFFIVAPAVWRHRRAGAVMGSVVRWTIPSAVVGAVAGVWLSELAIFRGAGKGYLQLGFAGFMVYAMVYNILRLRSKRPMPPPGSAGRSARTGAIAAGAVGLPTGLLAGLLGVGGGVFAVPAQQICLRIPLANAIANSATTILFSSVVGAVIKNGGLAEHGYTIHQSLLLAAVLIPTAMVASWVTAARVHHWPVGAIRLALVILLVYCSSRMAQTGWGQLNGRSNQSHARPQVDGHSAGRRVGDVRSRQRATAARPLSHGRDSDSAAALAGRAPGHIRSDAFQKPSGSLKSARKIWLVPVGPRWLVHIIRLPSGLMTGSPSNRGLYVTRWCLPVSIFNR